jgi:lysozyme
MPQITSALELVKYHEGCTLKAIKDTKGKWSIGYGDDGAMPGQTCTQDWADAQVAYKVALAEAEAYDDLGTTWGDLDPVRQAVLTDMAYELGEHGLGLFTTFLSQVRAQNWPGAVADLKTTAIYAEVPTREAMNSTMLLTGQWPVI